MRALLSQGNMKIGRIWNISLPMGQTCPSGVPCLKECYAMKAWKQYPNVRDAWKGNYAFFLADGPGYFEDIIAQLEKKRSVKLFRWHVGGDIPSMPYLEGMARVAIMLPKTRFYAFTKAYHLLEGVLDGAQPLPKNLTLIASAWPGWPMPARVARSFPVAYVRGAGAVTLPSDVKSCPGHCDRCPRHCALMKAGDSVVFDKH